MNFTYLLGAGASAKALPVIASFSDGLNSYLNNIKITQFQSDGLIIQIDQTKFENAKDQLVRDLDWLFRQCKAHSSIDTFAKKLYLSKNFMDFYKVKFLLGDFLLYAHKINGIDMRYDAFFATILNVEEGVLRLPPNINILTWNYDRQLELSFSQFLELDDCSTLESYLNVYPRRAMTMIDKPCFNIIKLNGSIGGYFNNDEYKSLNYPKLLGLNIQDFKRQLIIRYGKFYDLYVNDNISELNKMLPTLLYCWEDNPLVKLQLEHARKSVIYTNILIVIGYSFPTFNRIVDKDLLWKMAALKKIYIQSPEKSSQGVVQRLSSLLPSHHNIQIIPITNTEEFFLPFEF